MPETGDAPDFERLALTLYASGIAPRYVARAIEELAAHHEDLCSELAAAGFTPADAQAEASRQLGDLDRLGREIAARPELRCWYYRWPQLGRIALPAACVAALPLVPVAAGVRHASTVFRWGLCMLLSGAFTLLLFATLQVSITP